MLAVTFVQDFLVFIFPVTASFATARLVLPFRQAGGRFGGRGRFRKPVLFFGHVGRKVKQAVY